MLIRVRMKVNHGLAVWGPEVGYIRGLNRTPAGTTYNIPDPFPTVKRA